jgi:hypothetical protein
MTVRRVRKHHCIIISITTVVVVVVSIIFIIIAVAVFKITFSPTIAAVTSFLSLPSTLFYRHHRQQQ